ncbi:MAG: YfhO family protein, partial [Anaerolineales bacterium]
MSLALLLVTVALVGRPLLLGRVYNGGDITRQYLPQRVELARALRAGRLPWWSSRLGLGYPLLAEGETGALYPPNWLVCAVFSSEVGITVSIVLHYLWAALGMVLFLRRAGRSWVAAMLGAVAFCFGGFMGAHLSHLAMLTVASWLPWMLVSTQRLFAAEHRWRSALALTACVALQFLAGHAQMSLLGLLVTAAAALWYTFQAKDRPWSRLAAWVGAIAAGTLLALPQLLPTIELALQSQRAGGVDVEYFTSYSFHPLLTATFLSPFVRGAPDPEGSVELMAYLGILPLALAWIAVRHGHARERWFCLGLAAVGLVLAVGRWNPLYAYLQRIPVLNLFRVPARYLYWA